MFDPLRIVMATPTLSPFVPNSGLAEAVRQLADHLAILGHQVTIITPFHGDSMQRLQLFHDHQLDLLDLSVEVIVGSNRVQGKILRVKTDCDHLTIYLLDQPNFFQRRQPFGDQEGDYRDNCERFVFFARGVLELIRQLDLTPHVIHCHDWTTGLIPTLLAVEHRVTPGFESTSSVMTIHNASHQGQFWHWDMQLTGLDWKLFNWQQMEFFGKLNFLKTGIVFADGLTTVSQSYARDLLTENLGCGLHGVLSERKGELSGIQNGIDLERWNPESDSRLNRNYTLRTATLGKMANKQALQRRFDLEIDPRQMLIGVRGPFEYSRGSDLIPRALSGFMQRGVQCVFIGRGENVIEQSIQQLSAQHPRQVAAYLSEDETSLPLLFAGSDLLLFPHRVEPSGSDAMIGCRYGTLPLAHQTGGLTDVVEDVRYAGKADSAANGFLFSGLDTQRLSDAIERSRSLFHFPEQWQEIVRNAMSWNWSWNLPAIRHSRLFDDLVGKKRRACSEVERASVQIASTVGIEHL